MIEAVALCRCRRRTASTHVLEEERNANNPLPLIFDFKQPISGNGFLAGVKVSGARALMLQEDGQWWIYGVYPAAVSECGATPNECFLRYLEELKSILFDFASDASDYASFEKTIKEFCNQSSADEPLWLAAQKKLRAGNGTVQTDEEFIQKLPVHRPEDRQPEFAVVRLAVDVEDVGDVEPSKPKPVFTPQDNVPSALAMAA